MYPLGTKQIVFVGGLLMLAVSVAAGCGSSSRTTQPVTSNSAGPIGVCGTIFSRSPLGVAVTDLDGHVGTSI